MDNYASIESGENHSNKRYCWFSAASRPRPKLNVFSTIFTDFYSNIVHRYRQCLFPAQSKNQSIALECKQAKNEDVDEPILRQSPTHSSPGSVKTQGQPELTVVALRPPAE